MKKKTTVKDLEKTGWTYIVLEGFCGYSWMHKKYMMTAPFDPNSEKKVKYTKMKNCCYVKGRIPSWCPATPSFICLVKNCPFFCYGEGKVKEEKEITDGVAIVMEEKDD